jgi:hypothetical protein
MVQPEPLTQAAVVAAEQEIVKQLEEAPAALASSFSNTKSLLPLQSSPSSLRKNGLLLLVQ